MTEETHALDEERIREGLRGEPFVRGLVVLPSVSSTNDAARQLAAEGAPEGVVVLAARQTDGRGRMGRSWHSPSGLGLFVSVLFRPRRAAAEATRWTLGAAVAGTQACRQLAGVQVEIEWPNDLVWEGRKLGGVLAEARSTAGGPTDLVVGTGVNVGHGAADLPDELATTATSLRLATGGHVPERETLAVRYVRLLAGIAGQLNRGEWNAVRRRWEELAPTASGHPVRVLSQGGRDDPYDGVTAGIDATGALRVRRSAGEVSTVHASDSVVWREV